MLVRDVEAVDERGRREVREGFCDPDCGAGADVCEAEGRGGGGDGDGGVEGVFEAVEPELVLEGEAGGVVVGAGEDVVVLRFGVHFLSGGVVACSFCEKYFFFFLLFLLESCMGSEPILCWLRDEDLLKKIA